MVLVWAGIAPLIATPFTLAAITSSMGSTWLAMLTAAAPVVGTNAISFDALIRS